MTITEKAAYLRGLVEGQGLDPEAGEGKLWRVLSELVGDLAAELKVLRDDHEELADRVEEMEDDLELLEDILDDSLGDEDFDFDEDPSLYPFGNGYFDAPYADDGEDDEDDEDDDPDGEDDFGITYEVECPNCGEMISFDDETLDAGSIYCPGCGAVLEFEVSGGEAEPEEKPEPTDPE